MSKKYKPERLSCQDDATMTHYQWQKNQVMLTVSDCMVSSVAVIGLTKSQHEYTHTRTCNNAKMLFCEEKNNPCKMVTVMTLGRSLHISLHCSIIALLDVGKRTGTHSGNFLIAFFQTGPEVINLFFSCSTQLSMKFFLLINIKMPTIVGILTFMSGEK